VFEIKKNLYVSSKYRKIILYRESYQTLGVYYIAIYSGHKFQT